MPGSPPEATSSRHRPTRPHAEDYTEACAPGESQRWASGARAHQRVTVTRTAWEVAALSLPGTPAVRHR